MVTCKILSCIAWCCYGVLEQKITPGLSIRLLIVVAANYSNIYMNKVAPNLGQSTRMNDYFTSIELLSEMSKGEYKSIL